MSVQLASLLQPPLLLTQWIIAENAAHVGHGEVKVIGQRDACCWWLRAQLRQYPPPQGSLAKHAQHHIDCEWAQQTCYEHHSPAQMKPLPLKPLLQVQVRALTGLVQSASLLQPPLLTLHEGAPETAAHDNMEAVAQCDGKLILAAVCCRRSTLPHFAGSSLLLAKRSQHHSDTLYMWAQAHCYERPLTSVAIASEARLAGACVALRGVGAVGIGTAASVVGAAKDHGCKRHAGRVADGEVVGLCC